MASRRSSRALLQPVRHSGLACSLVALVAGRPRRFAYEVPSRFLLIVSRTVVQVGDRPSRLSICNALKLPSR